MTTRERWLLTGLILVVLALPVLAIWQQARYSRAERAVAEFIALEDQSNRADTSRVALVRQAKPEIQKSLSRGDFNAALARLAALRDEDAGATDDKANRKSIAMKELWPPGSAVRKHAQQVLLQVARKQREGYDVEAAHEALVRVADAARAGKKKDALAAFKDVETLTTGAPLRPGFRTVANATPPTAMQQQVAVPPMAGSPGRLLLPRPGRLGRAIPTDLNNVTPAQVQQFLQFFQLALPQLMERANPEQRDFLRRLQPFVNEAGAAYSQGKDIRPIIPLMQKLGRALQTQNQAQAETLLAQAQVVLRTAKPMPKGAAGPPAAPSPQMLKRLRGLHGPPLAMPPAGLAPVLPRPGRPNGGGPPRLTPENILQALDTIRQLPEPVYRQQRPQIAMLIGRAFAGMGPPRARPGAVEPPPPRRTPSPGPAVSGVVSSGPAGALHAGSATAARLDFSPTGDIVSLTGLSRGLSEDAAVGGVYLVGEHGETQLRGALKMAGRKVAGSLTSTAALGAQCDLSIEPDGRDITIHGKFNAAKAGAVPGVALRLPIRAAGWYWDAGDTPQVIAVDGHYQASAAVGGHLPLVTLRGAGIRVAVSAPAASSVSYDGAAGSLVVRFPLAPDGATEFSVGLTVSH